MQNDRQKMSISCRPGDAGVLVRFWTTDHVRPEPVLWTESEWTKLVYAAEGALLLTLDQERHLLPANRALLLGPGQRHQTRTTSRARIRTLFFAPSLAIPGRPGAFEVRPLFRELIREPCRVGPLMEANEIQAALARKLVSEAAAAPEDSFSLKMPLAEWAAEWAEAFLADPAEARSPACSRRTLERTILRETGLTLGEWSRQARMMTGVRLLTEGAPVQEAAMAAGYRTVGGFIQSHRRFFGRTPGRRLQNSD